MVVLSVLANQTHVLKYQPIIAKHLGALSQNLVTHTASFLMVIVMSGYKLATVEEEKRKKRKQRTSQRVIT